MTDISAMDISAMENAKGGRIGNNHKSWVQGDVSLHVCMHHACVMPFLGLAVYIYIFLLFTVLFKTIGLL